MVLFGAGCGSSRASLPNQQAQPLYQPPPEVAVTGSGTSPEPSMRPPESPIQWNRQQYDLPVGSLDLGQYTMPNSLAKRVLASRSCDLLRSAPTSTTDLGFGYRNSFCEVMQIKGTMVFVMSAVDPGYETYPFLGERYLMLKDQEFIVGFPTTSTPMDAITSKVISDVVSGRPRPDFPSPEFTANYHAVWDQLTKLMKSPTPELRKAFDSEKTYLQAHYDGSADPK